MTQLNTTPWLPFTYSIEVSQGQNNTSEFSEDEILEILFLFYIATCLISFICLFGLVGNATVIWYLCFLIKKNPITTYVLNLAVADSGVLLTLEFICIVIFSLSLDFPIWLLNCFILTYTSSQYLLTAISAEKCLSVVFPIWYRCHRPKYLSALICTLLWIMSCLMCGELFSFIVENSDLDVQITSIINFMLCTPVVIICTILLFIRTYCSLYQHRRSKFYAALMLILLIFISFGTPLSVIFILIAFEMFYYHRFLYLLIISITCASINSSVNPLIYFLIGRKKMKRSRQPFRLVLQRVFSDNIDCRVGGQPVPSVEK